MHNSTILEKPQSFVTRTMQAILLSCLLMFSQIALSQSISFNGTTYTQDFQSMTATALTPSASTSTTMLQVSAQTGGGTVNGWYFYFQAGTARWGRNSGSNNTGSVEVLFDAATPTPGVALGSLSSGSNVALWGIVLKNTTGATINSVNISYDAVMNRNPATTANAFPMSYRVSATDIVTTSSTADGTYNDAAGTWIAGTGFTTPSSGTGAPGTQAAITPLFRIGGAAISQTLTGLNWGNNQFLYIRWKDVSEAGANATGGVDNFSLSVPSAPEINLKQGANSIATAGSFAFGNQTTGTSSAVTTFTVENTGTATLNLTGTPKIAISGTNAAEFTVDQSATTATVAAAGNTTFTITFSPTSPGSKTAAISIANDDATGSENPYVVNLTGTGAVSTASDIIEKSGHTYPTNIAYGTYQATNISGGAGDIEIAKFSLRDGGASADADNLGTTLSQLVLNVGNFANVRQIAVYDDLGNEVAEQSVSAGTVTFSGLTYVVADDASRDFSIRVSFKSGVTDNQKISIAIAATTTAAATGSTFAATNAGGASTTLAGADDNKIAVVATDILFDQQPQVTISELAVMIPAPSLRAIDNNVNFDLDYSASVTMSLSAGSTTFDPSATTTVSFVAGVATFSNLVFNTPATANKITATSGAFSDESTAFDVTSSQPEINIKQNVTSIATGGTFGFGNQVSGTSGSALTFTIENIGTSVLNITGTPKVVISGTNAAEFTVDETATAATVATSSSTTFTITFSPTSQGSKTAAISIANNDITGSEDPYVINLTGTGTVSAVSDITTTGGYSYTSNVNYAASQAASALTTGNSVGVNGLTIRDGGATTDADNLGTTLTNITFSTGGSTAIRTAALFDAGVNVAEVAVNGSTSFAFSGLSLTAADGGTKDFELRVTYQSAVTDNQQITFTVSAATAATTGSDFAAANAGAAASSATGDINRIEVSTTQLVYTQQPTAVNTGATMTPAVTITARDANNNADLDFTDNVRVSATGLTGSPVAIAAASGVATFNALVFTVAGSQTLLAERDNGGAWDLDVSSNAFTVTAVSTATDFFRSAVTTGNWNTAASWESSADGSTNWIPATLAPSSTANTITIQTGHAITAITSVTVDQVVVSGSLIIASGIPSAQQGVLNLSNGTGDDLTITNGGTLQITGTANYATTILPASGSNFNVNTGGRILIGSGSGVGSAYNTFLTAATTLVTWNDGAILEWNSSTTFGATGITFFPGLSATTVPVFRITVSPGTPGGGTALVVNGKLESNATFTWNGNGFKTFRDGITGTGTLTQSTIGQFVLSGTNAELGGSGAITLFATGGLSVSAGTTTLSSNKTINGGPITVTGTLSTGAFSLNGTSPVTVNAGGLLRGTGSVTAAVTVNGTISPNTSGTIGTFTTGNLTLGAGGTYVVDINDIPSSGTAGVNWDVLAAGAITNSATGVSPFVLSLNGTIANFSSVASYTWPIGTYTGAAPSATNITINTAGITNNLNSGTFAVSFSGGFVNLVFTPSIFTITASVSGANGTIAPLGATQVNLGGSQAYTITPDANYHVADVLVDGVSQGAITTYTFSSVNTNHTIVASFAINTFNITASVSGGNGTIAPNGVTAVGFGGSQAYTITPNSGYHVADVLVDGVSQGAITTYTFSSVSATHTIEASFAINTYTITASADAGGSISPNGVTTVNSGASQAYTITATGCSSIADVLVDGVSQGPVSGFTFNNVTANHTISVSFSSSTFTQWTGAVSTDWNDPANWTACVPDAGKFVYIPANGNLGVTQQPALTADATTGDLEIDVAASITIGSHTLTINGAYYDDGGCSLIGSASSNLVFNAAATFSSASTLVLKNLTVNAGTVTLTTAVEITGGTAANTSGTVTVATGAVLESNGFLTLKSNQFGTARVAPGDAAGNYVSGDVTVERYIPNNGFRSWRLLSVPTFGNGQTIRQAWQEGAANPLPLQNNLPNFGTQITGTGVLATAQANGFDNIGAAAALLSWGGAAWVNATTTNTAIATKKGYFLYLRGERSQGVTGATTNSSATTLRTTGQLYQGTQAIPSFPANGFNLVGNLYPSAINFTQLTRTGGVNNLFYIWDSKKLVGTSLGYYQTFSATNGFQCLIGGGSYTLGQANTTIESGQAFFVVTGASTGSITLTEGSKIANSANLGFRPTSPAELVKIDSRLYSNNEVVDANVVVFDNNYSNEVATEDALKLANKGENFGIQNGAKTIAIEGRPMINSNESILFNMWNLQQQEYKLEIAPNKMAETGLTALLKDSYLQTSTPISLDATTTVSFTVDANPDSKAANRFSISFKKLTVLPVAEVKPAYVISPNPVEGGVVNLQFKNQPKGNYVVRVIGNNGQAVSSSKIAHAGGSATQLLNLPARITPGMYQVEIIAADKTVTTQSLLVK